MEKIKTILKKLKIDKIYKAVKIFFEEGFYVLIFKIKNRRKDQATLTSDYQNWIKYNEKNNLETIDLEYNPYISVVIPVYNVPDQMLIDCIESVIGQTYTNWQICLADDNSSQKSMREILKKYENHPKVKVVYREENGHISRATNSAIDLVDGEFIAFMDCDDTLAPNALYEVARKLNENPEYDFIYTDEDKIDEKGIQRWDPHFKPDWSPDTLMTMMYTSHLGVYRTSLVRELNGLRVGFEGSQDYDFTLRFVEKTNKIGHIPKVLYHWRQREGSTAVTPDAKPYVFEAAKKAKIEALERRNIEGKVDPDFKLYQAHITYFNSSNPLVSIIIPSKDNYEVYKRCVETLHSLTTYKNYEIIHVDNGSDINAKKQYEKLDSLYGHKYIYDKMEFNFSQMCNIGAENAKGDFLLFLNDDIEIFKSDWLDILTGQASLDHVGAVGAKLYYPNSTLIQHCGVINISQGPVHMFGGLDDTIPYYFGRNILDFNVIAVTGACLMIDRNKFQEINGFDETFAVTYNDVDLCFRLVEKGYYNVVRNDAILYHHESLSRGNDVIDEAKMQRLIRERDRLYEIHPQFLNADPFYSPNLTQLRNDFSLQLYNNDVGFNNIMPVSKETVYCVEENIIAKFDCKYVNSYVFLQGYAFYKNKRSNNQLNAQILFEGENEILLAETNKIYRPDRQQLLKTKKHINLTGFNCFIDINSFNESKYTMKIVLDDKIADLKEMITI